MWALAHVQERAHAVASLPVMVQVHVMAVVFVKEWGCVTVSVSAVEPSHVKENRLSIPVAWSAVRVKAPVMVWAVAMVLALVKVNPSVMEVVNVMEMAIVKG